MRQVQVWGVSAARTLAILALVVAMGTTAIARIWKSSSGKYQIDAELIKYEDGQVTLRKSSGAVIQVPASKLSEDDRVFLDRQQAKTGKAGSEHAARASVEKIQTYASLSEAANRRASAGDVVSLFRSFISDTTHSEGDLQAARNHLPIWESRAAKKMVRLGVRWLEPGEAAKLRERAHQLVQEALQSGQNKLDDGARDKMQEASKENPEGIEADFLLGLDDALARRDFAAAKRHFAECVKRDPKHIASLNNLALADVRLKAHDEALHHWQAALQLAVATPEIVQNIGRFIACAEKRSINASHATLRKAQEVQASLAAKNTHSFDSSVGWLYMLHYAEQHNATVKTTLANTGTHNARRTSRKRAAKNDRVQTSENGYSGDWKPGEDPGCMRCGGCGTLKCPNRSCANGTIPGGVSRKAAGVCPGSGQTFYSEGRTRETCPVCGGRGRVPCPDCYQGIDKGLRGGSGY